MESWKEKDPIKLTKTRLMAAHAVSDNEIKIIQDRVEHEIADYIQFSLQSPNPDPEDGLKFVYADREVEGRK